MGIFLLNLLGLFLGRALLRWVGPIWSLIFTCSLNAPFLLWSGCRLGRSVRCPLLTGTWLLKFSGGCFIVEPSRFKLPLSSFVCLLQFTIFGEREIPKSLDRLVVILLQL
ncbi:hypothetical protein RHGRI_005342 [Rhododendron griersonianum]|uniref:Uncharacterized protein n=1 Tax=Rhododendron griersonianum TaxID=479676 RepID=A0AAV6LC82_9ERIC|nr:hypothetical protein RHGRI_005342 [Rhododendron griersonianum]